MRRLFRGLKVEEVAGVELVRTLLFIAGYAAALGGMHVWMQAVDSQTRWRYNT